MNRFLSLLLSISALGIFLPAVAEASSSFSDNFNASNQDINGYNNWLTYTSAGSNTTGQWSIVSSLAQAQTSDSYPVQNLGAQNFPISLSMDFLQGGTGCRWVDYAVLGSSNISSFSNFTGNGMEFLLTRSDCSTANTSIYVYDGGTLVASKSTSVQVAGSGTSATITVSVNTDGSGSYKLTVGASSDTLTWGARTWTHYGGNYFGFSGDKGTDGAGQTFIPEADNISYSWLSPFTFVPWAWFPF